MIHSAPSASAVAADQELAELVDRLTEQLAAGEAIDMDALAADYPQYAERLRALLPALKTLVEIGGSGSRNGRSFGGKVSLGSALPSREGHVTSDSPLPLGEDGSRSEPGKGLGTLGDFRLVREIGRGGMGIVYEAEQLSLRRRVALKILPLAGMLDERALTRFRNEAQAAAGLHHPHIVPIHGVGCERGVHFLAMQLIDGVALDRVIEEVRNAACGVRNEESNPISVVRNPESGPAETLGTAHLSTERTANPTAWLRRVATLAAQAAEALHYAHERGIIHRDVKPANLLVDRRGGVWITDFGLARIDGADNLTLTGDLLGTLRYMSPEQASGNRLGVDHRTDIYSLGATLYELLTLRPAITGNGREHLLHQILNNDPTPPRRLDRRIPADLETITLKALANDPADRYATAAELAADLRRFLDHQPIRAHPPSLAQRLSWWSQRNRTLVRSMTAALVVSSLSLGIAAICVVNERQNTEIERIGRQSEAKVAERGRKAMQDNNYVTRINLASRALHEGLIVEARDYLGASISGENDEVPRGFEWHYLWRLTGIRSEELGRHTGGEPWRVITSPDGRVYATCAKDGARFWDAATGSQISHIADLPGGVNSVCFSPDARLVGTSGDDGQVRIWSAGNWRLITTLAHDGPLIDAVFSADAQRLISVAQQQAKDGDQDSRSNALYFWDTSTWTCEAVHPFQKEAIESGDVTDDSQMIASSSLGAKVYLWDGETGALRRGFEPHYDRPSAGGVSSLDFAHQHPWIATTSPYGITRIWDRDDGGMRTEILLPSLGVLAVNKVLFSPNDRWLAIACDGRCFMAEIGDDGSGKVVFQFVVPMRCRAIAFADDETLLATNSSGQVSRIHLPLNKLPRRLLFDKAASPRIDFSPDNRLLVVTREAVELYDLRASGNPLRNRRVEKGIASAVYSPDGSTLLIACQAIDASGKNTHQITILDAATWQSIRSVSPVAPDCTVKFVNNGHNIVTLSDDHVDRWFEYPSLQPCAAPVADMGIIALPHLDWFLGGMHAEGLTCFDRSGERWRQKISGMRDRHAVAISPDGKCIAIGRHNGNITFYDPRNGRTESAFLATDIRIDRLVYSADARTLAGWTGHQKLKLWHVATGRDLLEIPVIGMGVDQLAFSPDGRVLAVAGVASSGNGQVLLYQTYDP